MQPDPVEGPPEVISPIVKSNEATVEAGGGRTELIDQDVQKVAEDAEQGPFPVELASVINVPAGGGTSELVDSTGPILTGEEQLALGQLQELEDQFLAELSNMTPERVDELVQSIDDIFQWGAENNLPLDHIVPQPQQFVAVLNGALGEIGAKQRFVINGEGVLVRGRGKRERARGASKGREERSKDQETQEGERLIGEGLEMSPEEQQFLLRVEKDYRDAYVRAKRQPNFNLAQFKQEQINRLESRVSGNTKFHLNKGVPGSFVLGIHSDKAPYKEPTQKDVKVLLAIEQRYNSELNNLIRNNGGRALSPNQIVAFKTAQISRFNQDLSGTDSSVRLYLGIPGSYSFGIDWTGEDAQQPSSSALIGHTGEAPRAGVSPKGRTGPVERLQAAPNLNEFLQLLAQLLQKLIELLEGVGDEQKEGKEDEKADADVQREIDEELEEDGMTPEKLREKTEGELEDSRKEAKDLKEKIPEADKKLGEMRGQEKGLEGKIQKGGEGVDDLKAELGQLKEAIGKQEEKLATMQARLKELNEKVIPRLERKIRLLKAMEKGDEKPKLTEEQRDQVRQAMDAVLEQVDPEFRKHLGEFHADLNEDGQPAIFPDGPGLVEEIAGEKGHITMEDLTDPAFAERAKEALAKLTEGEGTPDDVPDNEPGPEGEPGSGDGVTGPEGPSDDLLKGIDQTSEGLTDYLQRTEDFIRRRVDMYRARVKGTQKDIDDANGWNVFDWKRQGVLKDTLQKEQQALDQSLDALSKIDAARGKVDAKIAVANDTSKDEGERVQALKDGRQVLEDLRGLIQDPNYAAINEELSAIDDQLAFAENAAEAVSGAIGDAGEGLANTASAVGDYLAQIPGAVSDVWNQDVVAGWNAHIQPHLSSFGEWSGEQLAAAGDALGEIGEGLALLYEGTASEFGQGYKEQFAQMYGGGMEKLEGTLAAVGIPQSDINAFKQMVENSFDAAVDVTQDVNNRGLATVAGEMWDGVSHEAALAWNANIQPHLDTAGDFTDAQMARLGTLVNQVTEGARTIANGTATEFGQGYKEQFAQMYGGTMQQVEGLLTDAGVAPTDIAAFRQTVENSFDAGVAIAQDVNNRGVGVVAGEMWDGVSHEAALAWNANIQPHLDTAGDFTDAQLANLNTLVTQVTDGAKIIAQGTADQFGGNYKEQFAQMYGGAMLQIESTLTDAGVSPTDIEAFRQTVENSFDTGIAMAQDVSDRGLGVVAGEVLDGISHETALAWNENIQPYIDRGLDTNGPEWQQVGAALASLENYVGDFNAGDLVPDSVRPYIDDVQTALGSIPNIDLGTVEQMINNLTTGLNIEL